MIFHLHIPKTGGSTLVSLLENLYRERYYRTPNRIMANLPLLRQMEQTVEQFACISGHFEYGLHDRWAVSDATYITLVRDPVDRLLSLYHYLKDPPQPQRYTEEIRALTFADFCRSQRTDWMFLDNDMVRRISGFGPRLQAVGPAELEQAWRNLDRFAPVGLTDRFDESVRRWASRFGWEDIWYEHRLAQPNRLKRAQLPESLVDEIRDRQRYDQALYERILERDWADG